MAPSLTEHATPGALVDAVDKLSLQKRSFGKPLLNDFQFGKNWRNLNHGSFGAFPHAVAEVLRSMREECERSVDVFMLFSYSDFLDRSRAAIAPILNAPTETLAFVQNATTGVNTVLRNLAFEPGDHIVYFATIYHACGNIITYLTETTSAQAAKIEYDYPVSDDWIVQALRDTIAGVRNAGGSVRVAVFDTVISNPGVRMPFERLTRTCKELGVMSLVDAAHGVGHVDLNLTDLDPDFLVSNCHKWLYVPRPCAIFYVPIRNQHLLRTTMPTSHGFVPLSNDSKTTNPLPSTGRSPWQNNFDFVGTLDSVPYYCVPAALKYRDTLGGEAAIREYCFKLARKAGAQTASILGTEVLENAEGTLGECCFSNVRLPLDFASLQSQYRESTNAKVEGLQDETALPLEIAKLARTWISERLIKDYHTFVPTFYHGKAVWVRLSAQTYLELSDFEWLAGVLKSLCDRFMRGEGLIQ